MTRGQANILGGAILGTLFSAAGAGLISAWIEFSDRSLSTSQNERSGLLRRDVLEKHPPSYLAILLVSGISGAIGGVLGACAVLIPGLILGRRRESYLLDVVGGIAGALFGMFAGLLAHLTSAIGFGKDAGPLDVTAQVFMVLSGAVFGVIFGMLLGAGIRHHTVCNRRDSNIPSSVSKV